MKAEDLVTAIVTERAGAKITLNGEETLWFPKTAWLERELCEGEAVALSQLKAWLLPRQYPEALNAAVRFLTARQRSAAEVWRKLEAKPYLDETIEMVLYKLEKEKLLDDAAFAADWAKARSQRQVGGKRIAQELQRLGIDSALAQEAVAGLDQAEGEEAALAVAAKLLKRYQNEPDARKGMNKLMAAMARRGYSFAESERAVQAAIARAREEE